jgi:hypothetical protein
VWMGSGTSVASASPNRPYAPVPAFM